MEYTNEQQCIERLIEIRDIIIEKKCVIKEACGTEFAKIKKIMGEIGVKTEEYNTLVTQIELFGKEAGYMKMARMKAAGENVKASGHIKISTMYEKYVVPFRAMSNEEQDIFMKNHPIIDIDIIEDAYKMEKSIDEKQKKQKQEDRIKNGNKLLKEELQYLIEVRDYMKNKTSTRQAADKENRFIRIENHINSYKGNEDYNQDLVQESIKIIKEIRELTNKKQESTLRFEQAKKQMIYDMTEFSRGAFEKFKITNQEEFQKFFSRIPDKYTNIKKNALENWNVYLKCRELPTQEIEIKLNEEKNELRYLDAYYKIVEKGVKCDYTKLKNRVSVDELQSLIGTLDNISMLGNTRLSKDNPFYQLIIDKEDEEAWERQGKYRKERLSKKIEAQKGRIKMINGILENKKKSQSIEENAKSEEYDINSLESKNEADNFERTEEARREKVKKLKTLISRNSELDAEIAEINSQLKGRDFKD